MTFTGMTRIHIAEIIIYDNILYHIYMENAVARGPKSLTGTRVRIRGMSALGFGASWDVSNADRDEVRGFLTFLEDRRALYVAHHLEVPSEVERSVHDIRKRCTEALAAISERAPARRPIQAIRAASRRFLEEPHVDFRNLSHSHFGRFATEAGFFTALGELRANVGAQIALLATAYEIEIEPELAAILPPEDEDAK